MDKIDELYLSLDVIRGLRIVGNNFPKAGDVQRLGQASEADEMPLVEI